MKKKNLMKSLTALVLSVLMVLSLAACGAKPSDGGKDEDKDGYTVAIIKQMDHASLDEIADAIAARLDAIAQEQNVSIRYTITSGQGDQSVLKQLADQAVADKVDAIIPIATTAAQVSAVAAEDSRTPVVYAAISDPDTAKLTGIDYVTGTSDALNTEYILDMMLAQDPGVSKVGLLYSLSEPNSTKPIAEAKAYLEQHGITCVEQTANTNDEVVAAAAALISVIRALTVSPDSEFVAIAPYFPEYLPFVESNGGKLVSVPADLDTFQISLDILEAHLTSHTQAVLVNSPNNPTGVVYSRQTLEGLAELLRRKSTQFGHPIYLIADEPYRELVYDGVEVPFLPTIYPNTLVCYSYSKSLSLPGERIGYVCVPSCVEGQADVLHAVAGAARSSGHVCPPTLVQLALQRCADARPDLAAYDANRRLLYRELTQMGYECIPPQGAFYLFLRVPDGDDVTFSRRAKLEHDLLVVPSTAFHCPGFLRLSYCVSHDMILRSLPAFRAIREKYQ